MASRSHWVIQKILQIIDTTKFAFERYYKFDIPATVKADVAGGVDIENTAAK